VQSSNGRAPDIRGGAVASHHRLGYGTDVNLVNGSPAHVGSSSLRLPERAKDGLRLTFALFYNSVVGTYPEATSDLT
jgi:hypothetical protein